jgi:nicotinate phosphoribosyltransferase
MQQAVIDHFPRLRVRYKFTDRNGTQYPDGFDELIKSEVKEMEKLALTKGEKTFLTNKCGNYLKPTYIDFLEGYRYDSSELVIKLDKENHLDITIEGYWYRTINWEVSLMGLISELYFKATGQIVDLDANNINDNIKIEKMIEHNAFFSDFGMRRRYSYENQDRIIKLFLSKKSHVFVGTSNIHFAYKYNINVVGTCAHEWIMVHAALYGYKMSNKLAMDNWVNTYGGQLGTMLVDTFTTDVFLKSFDSKYARLYDGVRHDSGNPFEFVDKFVSHYKKLNIDPMSKTIIFSDGLDIELATQIKEYCVGKIKSAFGIGTHLTNNVLNTIKNDGTFIKPLNMVIKISDVFVNDEWIPAVKLSDNKGKNTGKVEEVKLCKQILNIES